MCQSLTCQFQKSKKFLLDFPDFSILSPNFFNFPAGKGFYDFALKVKKFLERKFNENS